ncbi:MAG TPA: DUF2071 domain-containing protein [Hanamia sp.]|nr:DUF2071 domain-containing protein [Hanamia sp.]
MLSFLKNHPFAVEAHFESSLVFTFAFRKEVVQPLIPSCLQLDTFKDRWAFIAVAMVQTKGLRPKGFPKFMGNDFFLIGYRVFVRFTNKEGRSLRGLYILQSETDKKKMEFLGNLFTHYNYTTTDIRKSTQNETTEISSHQSAFNVSIENAPGENISLPAGSPFNDWKEARRFAGPLPFTFTYNPSKKTVLIIEGVRENWKPAPVKVNEYHFSWLDKLNLQAPTLASAFIIKDIPYYWKKGKIEKWKE